MEAALDASRLQVLVQAWKDDADRFQSVFRGLHSGNDCEFQQLRLDDLKLRLWVVMLAFLVQPETAPFTIALLLMLLIGAVEALGLGGSAIDIDMEGSLTADALDWLNVGHLPLLIVLVVFLTIFGLAGLFMQQTAIAMLGGMLQWFVAVPAATAVALPGTRLLSRGLAKVLPRDETTAVEIDSLLGRRARIVVGAATRGSPARARVEDRFGHVHFVMVEPVNESRLTTDDLLLLTSREGTIFRAVDIEPDIFSELGPLP